MSKPIFSVYEQGVLSVGRPSNGSTFTAKHLQQLAQLQSRFPAQMYRLEYQSVRWGNYVGLIELPEVIIEILPKIDRSGNITQTRVRWTQLLQQFDFLPQLGNLNPQLLMQPGELTETLHRAFITEVKKITQRGLSRQYQSRQAQQPFLRGRLLFTEQIRSNLVQKHRFYVQSQSHTKDHLLNQRIKQALQIVAKTGRYSTKTSDLLRYFRSVNDVSLNTPVSSISLDPVTQHYQLALQLADLICHGYLGGTFAGQDFGFSLMFDMSRVFELLIYYHLRNLSNLHNFTLHYQPRRIFWQTKSLRPDFLLELDEAHRVIIDTKWKVLTHSEPNDEDLRQVFTYTQVFEAKRGILLYPKAYPLTSTVQPFPGAENYPSTGEVQFISVLDNMPQQLSDLLFA